MSSFELLKEANFYKQNVTVSEGRYTDSGIWIDGNKTITYSPFEGFFEPYQKGESAVVLPEGVSSSDVIWVSTLTSLKAHNSLVGKSAMADKIALTNPEVDSSAQMYVVWNLENWEGFGMELLSTPHFDYLCVREDRSL